MNLNLTELHQLNDRDLMLRILMSLPEREHKPMVMLFYNDSPNEDIEIDDCLHAVDVLLYAHVGDKFLIGSSEFIINKREFMIREHTLILYVTPLN